VAAHGIADDLTPAMAAGVESRLWEIGDIVKVVEGGGDVARKVAL
jgi:hypothetical protein